MVEYEGVQVGWTRQLRQELESKGRLHIHNVVVPRSFSYVHLDVVCGVSFDVSLLAIENGDNGGVSYFIVFIY